MRKRFIKRFGFVRAQAFGHDKISRHRTDGENLLKIYDPESEYFDKVAVMKRYGSPDSFCVNKYSVGACVVDIIAVAVVKNYTVGF